ncbi:MAG: tyrosine-type recombinase/integrase [Bacteroidota bacterium]
MASLYRRGNSVWIKYTDANGFAKRKSTGIVVKRWVIRGGKHVFPASALIVLRQIDAKIRLRQFDFDLAPRKPVRVTELLDLYLADRGGTRKAKTQAGYRLSVSRIVAFTGNCFVSSLTKEKLFAFRQAMISASGEINAARIITALGPLFTWAVDHGYLQAHPITRDVRIHPVFPKPVLYGFSEVQAVFDYARNSYVDSRRKNQDSPGDPDLANQLEFLYLTGFRSAESCNLRIEQVDMHAGTIEHFNEKEGRPEYFPIYSALRSFFEKLPRMYPPFVFRYRSKTTLSHRTRECVDALIAKGVKINPRVKPVHSLKKTYGKRLIKAGVHPSELSRLMHHRSFQTTETFYNTFELSELAEALEKGEKVR